MFKAIVSLALFSSSIYAQDLQSLINQAGSAVGGFVDDLGGLVQTEDSVALNVNEYEWVLTSYDGELEFSISELPESANNLAPAVSALLAGAQDNAGSVNDALNANSGVVVNDNGLADQLGPQIQGNSEDLTNQAVDAYNNAAVALLNNDNGVRDQVNQQLNDAASGDVAANPETLNNLINQAITSVPNNLVEVDANSVPALAEVAGGAASSVDANQAVDAYNNAAGQAAESLSGLPAGVSSALSNAASNVAAATSSQLNVVGTNIADQAAGSLDAAGVDVNSLGNQ